MSTTDLNQQINALLEHDPEYEEIQKRVQQLEPEYLRISRALSRKDRELLSDYIAACEELEYYRIYPAFWVGRRQPMP